MKKFMDENFLLNNQAAVTLYHEYAKQMPIYDYHCHLSPKEIAENKSYKNITELWLGGDHYKWRALRSNGVAERYITGDAPDKEKFLQWAATIQKCIGNPLYHWTHLELQRFFGINQLLSPETAEAIWDQCNHLLQSQEYSARGLIQRSQVQVICTTDDPFDSLEYHQAIGRDPSFPVKVVPAFRPDKGINIDKTGFQDWIRDLGRVSKSEITSFSDFKSALQGRIRFFHENGCRVSDHALDPVVYCDGTEEEASEVLRKALTGRELSQTEIEKYKTQVLLFLGRQYSSLGWTMQFHIGTIRNNNQRMLKRLGPDTGFDAIADYRFAQLLAQFLDRLDATNQLPKTILYCLNPGANEVLGTIIGCFQGEIPGKLQFGTAWWFNDQKDGMIRQITALANLGLLSNFVGMVTDSRSFLSYTRHEYFRRILCNLLGEWVEAGEVPNDIKLLGGMVQDISFNNAKNYFGI